MNEYKLNELKSVISNYIFDNKIEWLLAYIKDIILLSAKNYSIYFENETIFIYGGFVNPQLFLKRLYYDNEDKNVYIEVQENNKTERIVNILFSELSKENIIMLSLKLLNNDLYKKQTLYIKKNLVESLLVQSDNIINSFRNELKNYLVEKYELDNKNMVVFDKPMMPVWITEHIHHDPIRLTFNRIVLTKYDVELLTDDDKSVYLSKLDYDSLKRIYYILD